MVIFTLAELTIRTTTSPQTKVSRLKTLDHTL